MEAIKQLRKKYLIKNTPTEEFLKDYEYKYITIYYLSNLFDKMIVRAINYGDDKYYLELKEGTNNEYIILRFDITKEEFENISYITGGKQLYKKQYKIEEECGDLYLETIDNQNYLIEFFAKDEESYRGFKSRQWFDEEVTNNDKYRNRNLVIYGF